MDSETRLSFEAVHISINELKNMLTNHMSFEEGLNIIDRMSNAEKAIKDKVDTKRIEMVEDCLEEKASWKALYAGLTTVLLLGGLVVGIVEIVK